MGKILQDVKANHKKIFLQFGGQGAPYLKEITKLYKEEPLLKEYFDTIFSTISGLESIFLKSDSRYALGYDLKSWMDSPESAPAEDYLIRGSVSVPMIFLTQVGHFHLMTLKGYPISELLANSSGTTGHSQGILAATFASLGFDGKEFYNQFKEYIKFVFYLAYYAQGAFLEFEIPTEVAQGNLANGDKNPSPMVAIIGFNTDE